MPTKIKVGQLVNATPYVVEAKTADYTVTAKDMGKIFTTRGAGASVTFTLPSSTVVKGGQKVTFFNVADFPMRVQAAATGQMNVWNTSTTSQCALITAGTLIGGGFVCITDGTQWLTYPIQGNTSQGLGTSVG